MREVCKIIECNNTVMDGDFGLCSHRYGYCQIHKIEGTAEETPSFKATKQKTEKA